MMTQAKLDANRANAQKSTGPSTPEGKITSSRNSFKHGLYSKQLVVGAEQAAELDALKGDLRAEHQPANETEEILVNELAEQFWRLRRARVLEASLLDSETTVLTHLAAIQRMMSSAERGFHKALTALRQLQKDGVHPKTDTKNEAQNSVKGESENAKESGAIHAGVQVGLSETSIGGRSAGDGGAANGGATAAAVPVAGPVPAARAGGVEAVWETT